MENLLKTLFILIILLIGIVYSPCAQPIQHLDEYVLKVWSADEGLPSNNLRHIVKNSEGFLWISTFNGLIRFDGNKFKNYDGTNVPLFSTSAFYSIFPYGKNKLYISTQASGLVKYERGVFSPIEDSNNLPKDIQVSYLDASNRLWIGSRNAGVYYMDNGKIVHYSIPEFENAGIKGFTSDGDGAIWIASEGAGIAKVSTTGYELFSKTNGLVSNIVNSVVFHNEIVYAGTEKGLSVFEKGVWKTDERFLNVSINSIDVDKSNNFWFATDIGLARLNNANVYEFINEQNGLPSRQISSVAFDDEENIWLTTKRGGLVQLKISNFKNLSTKNGLSYHGVNLIFEAPNGKMYFGGDNGDVDVVDNKTISKLHLKKDLSNISVKDILVEENETIWLATDDGVIKKSVDKEEYFQNELNSLKSRVLFKDKDGIVWVGSRYGGLNKIYPDGTIKTISVKDGLGSDFIFSIDQMPDGRIVVGTSNGGLNIIDSNDHVDIFRPGSANTGLAIFNVYIENNNRMWLATNIGIYCYQSGLFKLINVKNGLITETVFDIVEDSNGDLWASSILGIIKINKDDAIQFVNGEREHINTIIFDNSDGMVSRECIGATRLLLAQDGKIYIPTIEGVAILNPKNIFENKKAPTVFIEEILADDEKVEIIRNSKTELSEASIEPGRRNYKIIFTSLSLYSPEKVLFKYKLQGFDEDWVRGGLQREAKYTNLPHGTYIFNVLATNNSGVWSENPAIIKIDIKPFFYKTRLFIFVLFIVFIGFTYLIYVLQTKSINHRNRKLVKINKELDSFTYSVSHDLKAPLSSIKGLLTVARLEKGENALDYYSLIEKCVFKLDDFIRDIIDFSKNSRMKVHSEVVNIYSLIEGLIEGVSYLIDEKKIKIEIEVSKELEVPIDKTRLLFILNNLLINSLRYADLEKDEPYVKLSAKVERNEFKLNVEDNGQGIKAEYLPKIFDIFYRANEHSDGSGLGLYIVKESLDKIKGKIDFKSIFGLGTTAIVTVPLKKS